MKIIDEREMQKQKKTSKNRKEQEQGRKEQGGTEAIVKGWELNGFAVI